MLHCAVLCAALLVGEGARADAEVCGRNALGLVAAYHHTSADLDTLLPSGLAPFSFADLERAANEIGLEAYLVRWSKPESARFDCPAILRVRRKPDDSEPDHFIACFGRVGEKIVAADFPGEPLAVPWDRFSQIWDGEMLYVESRPGRVIADLKSELRASRHWRLAGFWAGVSSAVLLLFCAARGRRLSRNAPLGRSEADRGGACSRLGFVVAGSIVVVVLAIVIHRTPTRDDSRGAISRGTQTLVADRDLILIEPKGAAEQNRRVVFRLANVTKKTITVRHATSRCTCMVVKQISGAAVEPGGSVDLELEVAIPRMGEVARSVHVYHDGSDEALVLQVRAHGSRPLPLIARKINANPMIFTDLSHNASAQTAILETHEKPGAPPWLSDLACDLDDVIVTPMKVDETLDEGANVVQRKYSWSIGWRKTPSRAEISGQLIAKLANQKGEILVGQVFARAASDAPFSPASVYLDRGLREREIVVVRQRVADCDWTIDDGFQPPQWLTIAPTNLGGAEGVCI